MTEPPDASALAPGRCPVCSERMADRIILIEDDAQLGAQVAATLREAGFEVDWRRDADQRFDPREYSLLVLDLMLPGTYGLDLLKQLRAESELPVLVLSARNETADKVRALKLGADDYVTKPFWPDELLARVQARLRRPSLQRANVIDLDGLRMDVGARAVTVDGKPIELTRVEFDLLAELARRPGAAVTRSWLGEQCLDRNRPGNDRALDVHISHLRKKLGQPDRIATVWGIGYRLEPRATR